MSIGAKSHAADDHCPGPASSIAKNDRMRLVSDQLRHTHRSESDFRRNQRSATPRANARSWDASGALEWSGTTAQTRSQTGMSVYVCFSPHNCRLVQIHEFRTKLNIRPRRKPSGAISPGWHSHPSFTSALLKACPLTNRPVFSLISLGCRFAPGVLLARKMGFAALPSRTGKALRLAWCGSYV
jgi:hypothetical protein